MTEQTADGYGDLVRLWQETALELPGRENLSVRLARLTFLNFRFWTFFEDAIEFTGALFVVGVAAVPWMDTGDWVPAALATTGGLFGVVYYWLQRRREAPLDPAADARTYHAALLDRIDGRIRLYGMVPYWGVRILPTYLPFVWMFLTGWRRESIIEIVGVDLYTPLWGLVSMALYVGLCWFLQRSSLSQWQSYRATVEAVYSDAP